VEKPENSVAPSSRKAWRNWLQKHHVGLSEVWLVFYKRHTGKPTLSYNDAVEEAICFGWIDGIRKSVDEERYTHRFTPRKANSSWSASNRKRVARMSAAGLMTPAGERAVDLAKQAGTWDKPVRPDIDTSMPPELRRLLEQDRKAADFFDSLAPSYQRQYLAWIATARRADTRQRRADEALQLLRAGRKLGMR